MADLDIKQTETLRAELQERYELDIEAEITAIVFVEGNGNKAKFTCEDTWKEPEPPKQHKPEYRLYIYEKSLREEPGVMPFGALDAAMTAFQTQQRNNHAKLILMEDEKVIQVYQR